MDSNSSGCFSPNNKIQQHSTENFMDSRALKIMEKMGYVKGLGLGKEKQGPVNTFKINFKQNRNGLGFEQKYFGNLNFDWDISSEIIKVKEELNWICSPLDSCNIYLDTLKSWLLLGTGDKDECRTKSQFCDRQLQTDVLAAKNQLELFEPNELRKIRTRANPFETIRNVFFLNRAALKMANIDAACDFMFTKIDDDIHHKTSNKPIYFADVCAGPGGFSEYILWKRQWFFKGFGFTLRGVNDFTLNDFFAGSPETFQTLYGYKNDGNIYDPDNINDFVEKVLSQTDNQGVHFMMSDGGFSVEGQEDLQEYLSQQLYLCQCLVALSIVRKNGHFVTKLFDTFTLFSVGLIYLMYLCFNEITVFKPNASRPANSERYLICKYRKEHTNTIRDYLNQINNQIWSDNKQHIVQIVPINIINNDKNFVQYIIDTNNRLCIQQILSLKKIMAFSKDISLIEPRQIDLKLQCLQYWNIPNRTRLPPVDLVPELYINDLVQNSDILFNNFNEITNDTDLLQVLSPSFNWSVCLLNENNRPDCKLYLGCGGTKVYELNHLNWMLTNFNIELPRGTLILAEYVKEYNLQNKSFINCLHVIDAFQLGDLNLQNISFTKRRDLIQIFCEAINQPYNLTTINIRIKPVFALTELSAIDLMKQKNKFVLNLPTVCNINNQLVYYPSFILFFNHTNNVDISYSQRYYFQLKSTKTECGDRWENLLKLFSNKCS